MSEKSSEKKLTSNPFKAEKTIGRIKNVLRNAPVIGTVADVVDIGKELSVSSTSSNEADDASIFISSFSSILISKGCISYTMSMILFARFIIKYTKSRS